MGNHALAALRADWNAGLLTEADQNSVEIQPVATRQALPQCHLGLERARGVDIAPQVGDPMHVGVDTDRRLTKPFDEHQIRGLATHPRELDQPVDVVWNLTTVSL